MRVTNHHGRGTAKHLERTFDAPHIDKARSPRNLYWTWDKGTQKANAQGECPGIEESELRYYKRRFQGGLDAQNDKYRARRQYAKVREIEDVYHDRNKQPEESLLYIGNKQHLGQVSRDELWACAAEYLNWERAYSKAHGHFYQPLALVVNVDERGQIHAHERGVYQYLDDEGNWRVGQAAALEAAGFPLPEPGKKRSRENNRKQVWDAARREKWLDIIEAHGFEVEREPEQRQSHLPLAAWQALQDAEHVQEQAEAQAKQIIAEADRKAAETLQEAQEESKAIRNENIGLKADNDRLRARNAALRASNQFNAVSGRFARAYQERVEARLAAPEPVEAPYSEIAPKRRVRDNQAARQAERVGMLQEAFDIDYSGHEREDRQL